MFPCHIFADDERLCTSGKRFKIITMPLLSVPSVSKEISPFMALKAYIPFVSKANFVISSDPFFRAQEHSLHFHRSISMILTQCNRRNSGCLFDISFAYVFSDESDLMPLYHGPVNGIFLWFQNS
jgi:hypothetical protein